ncbi:MAG: hypothetical protein CMP03_04715 [Woeseiaceae bacterium]|nr:hypothetical protein [Woeseiaceae bacterium]|tara:strand:- start:1712 stop:1891 length:180 start_codon:yes stop_codon:yes gene_type:complete
MENKNKNKSLKQSDLKKSEKSNNQKTSRNHKKPKEIGGRGGLDPSRYGDWEKDGRCIDF